MGTNGAILESLRGRRLYNDAFGSVEDGTIIGESVEFESLYSSPTLTPIDEAKAVTFGGKAHPKGGWVVVMAGGSGLTYQCA